MSHRFVHSHAQSSFKAYFELNLENKVGLKPKEKEATMGDHFAELLNRPTHDKVQGPKQVWIIIQTNCLQPQPSRVHPAWFQFKIILLGTLLAPLVFILVNLLALLAEITVGWLLVAFTAGMAYGVLFPKKKAIALPPASDRHDSDEE